MPGRCAAAPANDIGAGLQQLWNLPGELLGSFLVCEFAILDLRQPGVRLDPDRQVRVLPHDLCNLDMPIDAHAAVAADDIRPRPGQLLGRICHGYTHHRLEVGPGIEGHTGDHRQAGSLLSRTDGCENLRQFAHALADDPHGAAGGKGLGLDTAGLVQILLADLLGNQHLATGPHAAEDPRLFASRLPADLGASFVESRDLIGQVVALQKEVVCAEGISQDDLRASLDIGRRDLPNQIRVREIPLLAARARRATQQVELGTPSPIRKHRLRKYTPARSIAIPRDSFGSVPGQGKPVRSCPLQRPLTVTSRRPIHNWIPSVRILSAHIQGANVFWNGPSGTFSRNTRHPWEGPMSLRFYLAILLLLCVVEGSAAGEPFSFGLAAGDVTGTSAVLWTRADSAGTVVLQIGTDAALQTIVQTASVDADTTHDFTVKITINGLTPWTAYYYRFSRQDDPSQISRVGTFRTAPDVDQAQEFTFAFSGDANQLSQPFLIFDSVVADRPDFFIFDGDTIYADISGSPVATDLPSYREKYRGNRDSHMQDMFASMATWPMWDDHEVVNNYAGTDDPLVAGYVFQAYQAFFEYMPITPSETFRTYRSTRYGSLAEFFFLDGRQYRSAEAVATCGNAPPPPPLDPLGILSGKPDTPCVEVIEDPSRTMLGPEQLAWLLSGLKNSTATWKFIVSDVPMTTIGLLPYDNWDGYAAERLAIWQFIQENSVHNVTVLAADTHLNAFVPDVTHYVKSTRPGVLPDDFRIPEFIACPLGMKTFRQEVIQEAPKLLGLPPDALFVRIPMEVVFDWAMGKLRSLNDMQFLQPDRYSYLLAHVRQDGVSFEFKGLSPDLTRPTPAKVMFRTSLPEKQSPLPCGLLALLPLAAAGVVVRHFVKVTDNS